MPKVNLEDLSYSDSYQDNQVVSGLDRCGRSYATGKRKCAIARVWLKLGTGRVIVNNCDFQSYFSRSVSRMLIAEPFSITNRLGNFDVWATVIGGGLSGQAGALRHGISKALSIFEPSLRPLLKQNHMLTRDSRVTERKKPGQKGARGRFQFSKR